tara:strand:- start:507 stop:650 length:144 start_codon:yes stop_codon:yes gene_type:complete
MRKKAIAIVALLVLGKKTREMLFYIAENMMTIVCLGTMLLKKNVRYN